MAPIVAISICHLLACLFYLHLVVFFFPVCLQGPCLFLFNSFKPFFPVFFYLPSLSNLCKTFGINISLQNPCFKTFIQPEVFIETTSLLLRVEVRSAYILILPSPDGQTQLRVGYTGFVLVLPIQQDKQIEGVGDRIRCLNQFFAISAHNYLNWMT